MSSTAKTRIDPGKSAITSSREFKAGLSRVDRISTPVDEQPLSITRWRMIAAESLQATNARSGSLVRNGVGCPSALLSLKSQGVGLIHYFPAQN